MSRWERHNGCVGGKPSPEYMAWQHMRQRCQNPKHKWFADYGGRGIKVCDRWESFALFLEDVGVRPSPLHSLDRPDNNGDYGPGNIRWATKTEQSRNKRDTKLTGKGARQIKRRLRAGLLPKNIAPIFGVSVQTINDIRASRSWAEVP